LLPEKIVFCITAISIHTENRSNYFISRSPPLSDIKLLKKITFITLMSASHLKNDLIAASRHSCNIFNDF
jgi:hypothetical protein